MERSSPRAKAGFRMLAASMAPSPFPAPTEKVTSQSSEDTYQSLEKYAINLNEAARSGKLDPVIGLHWIVM